jgi:predicted amidohydrolase
MSSRIFVWVALVCIVPVSAGRAAGDEAPGEITIAAVQLHVAPELYVQPGAFSEHARRLMSAAGAADLYVFPEYAAAFLGLRRLRGESAGDVPSRAEVVRAARSAEPQIHALWARLAAERGAYILAGTALVARGDRLYNRALLYAPDGRLVWWQDKAFPGAPETELLQLDRGSPDDASSFTIGGVRIAVTICRDTYHKLWETRFPNADVWIDIKANELPYTEEYYRGALPARLPNSPVDSGLTVSLVGSVFGYTFSGPSLVHQRDRIVKRTDSIHAEDTLVMRVAPH